MSDELLFIACGSCAVVAAVALIWRRSDLIKEAESQRMQKMAAELRQSNKLEAVGRLAAGVAHEINTPVQFVGDSLHFVRDSVADLTRLLEKYQAIIKRDGSESARAEMQQAEMEADLSYLLENVPKALDRAVDGVGRVATIVRSMKQFSHPDRQEMEPADLNQAIESTLTIAFNEYKYVAELITDLGELPLVRCHIGDINQAVLNSVVNAAQAIALKNKNEDCKEKGCILVRTRHQGEQVLITVSDTGGGIPDSDRERIFEPFFTTKDVGEGTGQGLAIARSVVAEKHGGSISFESEIGKGTTFLIRLPVEGPSPSQVRQIAA